LKLKSSKGLSSALIAGKNLKPYQGLKLACTPILVGTFSSRKKPKTLSGIETIRPNSNALGVQAGKNLKPYQGLKQTDSVRIPLLSLAGKNLKPYQGLKLLARLSRLAYSAGKNLKPYQGLKLGHWQISCQQATP